MKSGFVGYRIRLAKLEDNAPVPCSEVIALDVFFKRGRGHGNEIRTALDDARDDRPVYSAPVRADAKAVAAFDALPRPKKPPGRK
jgi:hypothetical protein